MGEIDKIYHMSVLISITEKLKAKKRECGLWDRELFVIFNTPVSVAKPVSLGIEIPYNLV